MCRPLLQQNENVLLCVMVMTGCVFVTGLNWQGLLWTLGVAVVTLSKWLMLMSPLISLVTPLTCVESRLILLVAISFRRWSLSENVLLVGTPFKIVMFARPLTVGVVQV